MRSEEKQIRTCLVTAEKLNKADMIRIVSFRGENLKIDLSGKAPGRGCYVSPKPENIEKLVDRTGALLARSFRRQITREELEYLKAEFPKAVEEKSFRPRTTKPVAVRLSKEDYKKIIK